MHAFLQHRLGSAVKERTPPSHRRHRHRHRRNGYRPGEVQARALLGFAEPDVDAAVKHVDAALDLARVMDVYVGE